MSDGEDRDGGAPSVESLQRRIADLERFVSRLAHELTTPLVTIRGFSRLLGDMGGWDAMASDALDRIERSAGRAERIVHALLDETRADVIESVSMEPLVVETAADVADKHRHITVSVALDPESRAFASAAAVRALVANVLVGLARRTGSSAPVAITVTSTDAAAADTVGLRFVTAGPPFAQHEQRVVDGASPADDEAPGLVELAAASTTASSQAGRLWCGETDGVAGAVVVLALPRAG